jgi:uncharacterized 2Fe-2S/4Fe-4S cluster protein (DUF4445 family)
MPNCIVHPEREAKFLCMKHNIYLCDECLTCRDPELYCKFRQTCPIWFMYRQKKREERERQVQAAVQTFTVTFDPDNRKAQVSEGTTLLEAARAAEIPLNASCNGRGSCGKCKVILMGGEIKTTPTPLLNEREKGKNYILACMSTVHGDVKVKIPEETLERKLKVAGLGQAVTDRLKGLVTDIRPVLVEVPLELNPPTLEDPVSDLDRLARGLKKAGFPEPVNVSLKVVRELSAAMRDENWKVTAMIHQRSCGNEILRVMPGTSQEKSLGLAVDVGTTSIVVYLVDMSDGAIIAATSGHNRQAACGDDVINRIVCAEKDGVKKLSAMALSTINGLINETLDSVNAHSRQIKNIVLSGNTTMAHLLLQIEPRYIRRDPYIPTVSEFPIMKASEVGLRADPSASVFVMPGPASYVGGDIVSGVLYTGFHREEPMTLFIDVGTNGEIVLGNKDWLMTAACSAGPAFEGGGVRWGMRAEEGAIEAVSIDPKTLEPSYQTVGEGLPRGICGSGMIDLISEMLITGIIDQQGRFSVPDSHPRIRKEEGQTVYILEFANKTSMDADIVFTENDLNNILRSKGAVYAGFTVLLQQAGMDFSMVDRFIITGGFGQYLNIEKAVTLGLLPDIGREKFTYLGNSSAAGAYMALLSENYRKETSRICASMTYVDFSTNTKFMDEFTSALFLPHTDINQFPSVKAKLKGGGKV